MAIAPTAIQSADSFIQRDYSAAAKRALARKPALFINDEWVPSSRDSTVAVEDPSIGRKISRIVDASYKQSGIGREQARQGVEAYTEVKTVIIRF